MGEELGFVVVGLVVGVFFLVGLVVIGYFEVYVLYEVVVEGGVVCFLDV